MPLVGSKGGTLGGVWGSVPCEKRNKNSHSSNFATQNQNCDLKIFFFLFVSE